MQPVALILRPPLGECSEVLLNRVIELDSGQEVFGLSTISVHIGPILEHHGCSLVPFSNLLALGGRLPRIRALLLRSMLFPLDASHSAILLSPRFALLESLTIVPWFAPLSGEAAFSTSLFSLFLHTPRLRSLTVYTPMLRPLVEHTAGPMNWPDLPFSLEKFACFGVLPAPACAHIIARSQSTLEELKIDVPGDDDAAAHLLGTIAQAAPRMRVLDLRLRGDGAPSRVRPVFAALARAETLHLETPQALEDTLALLGGVSLRVLTLSSTRPPHNPAASLPAQLTAYLSQTLGLRSITLWGSNLGAEDRRALFAHSRARRIRC